MTEPMRPVARARSSMGRAVRRLAIALISAPIHAYRVILSPLLPKSCRFQPSCSAYALEAIAAHGPIKGIWLMLRRLSHCHPIKILGGGSGYDPVPPH